MPKIRKLKRKKRFRTNMNRKRLRNKLKKLPNIECPEIKQAWEEKKTIGKNLMEMGLAHDANKVIKIPNVKKEMLKAVVNGEEQENEPENLKKFVPRKGHVAESLEAEAKAPRAKLFRLPNNEVHFITYMMDKYGEDYKAMVRDRKNYNQMTWRQIKAKIERFKGIPEQYAEYLVNKGEIVLEDPTPLKKIKPQVLQEPPKKNPNAKPSRRKRKKSNLVESIWQEESIEKDVSFMDDGKKKCVDDSEKNENDSNDKKLKLFSDDEGSDNDEDIDDDDDDLDDDLDEGDEDDEDDEDDDDFSDSEDESDDKTKNVSNRKTQINGKQKQVKKLKR